MDAGPGSYFAPDRMFGLKGDPVLIPIPKPGAGCGLCASAVGRIGAVDGSEVVCGATKRCRRSQPVMKKNEQILYHSL
jgi:hypothetical protein